MPAVGLSSTIIANEATIASKFLILGHLDQHRNVSLDVSAWLTGLVLKDSKLKRKDPCLGRRSNSYGNGKNYLTLP
jgi:hypothetical protein